MKKIKIGPLELNSDLILAPMMDVTTPSYILTCRYFGGLGTFIYPMVFMNQIVSAPKTIIPHMEFIEKTRPCGIQVCGNGRSIEIIKKSMDILNSYNFDFLDINAGCPARHTCNSGGGASLLKPHRFNDFKNLISGVLKYSNKPVSVKIRIGWNSKDGLEDICKFIQDEGVSFLTIHARYAIQNYSGLVDLNIIKYIKSTLNIPVIGNGDVTNFIAYEIMKFQTKVDGVMIGRASQGNPRIFSEIDTLNEIATQFKNDDLILGELLKNFEKFNFPIHIKNSHKIDNIISIPISKIKELDYYGDWREFFIFTNTIERIRENIKILLDNIEKLNEFWNNDKFKLLEIRRNLIWILKGVSNSASIRAKIANFKDLNSLLNYLNSNEIINDLEIKN